MNYNESNIFFKKPLSFVISMAAIALIVIASLSVQNLFFDTSVQVFISIFIGILITVLNFNWGTPGFMVSMVLILMQVLLYGFEYRNSNEPVKLYLIGIALMSMVVGVMFRIFFRRVQDDMNSLYEKFEQEQTRRINSETKAMIEDTVRRTSLIVKHEDVKPDVSDVIQMSISKPIDTLTTLPNRDMLIEKLDSIIEATIKDGQESDVEAAPINIIYIMVEDEQRFSKPLGHRIVDLFIQAMAHKLREAVHPADIVGRISRNEFAIVTKRIASDNELDAYVNQLREVMLETDTSTFKCGIAQFPRDGRFPGELMHYAEVMMRDPSRKAEFEASNGTVLASIPSDQLRVAFDKAISEDEISVVYQPRFNKDKKLTGFEAFVRWNNPEYKDVTTREFLISAERTGHIYEIGRLAMNKALVTLAEINTIDPTLKMTINMSITEIRSRSIVKDLKNAIKTSGCDVTNIIIDIPEEGLQSDFQEIRRVLDQLSEMEVTMALDNFGRGYSSLNNVPLLPVSLVKLDSYFTTDLHHGSSSAILTKSIIELLNDIDIPVDATGVGTKEQFEELVSYGCTYFQGKYLCNPMSAGEVADYIRGLNM